MNAKSLLLSALLLVLSAGAFGDAPERIELANNLDREWYGSDRLTDVDWDAQTFNSGECRQLRRVVLNLYKDARPSVTPVGTFWVKLYPSTGVNGSPGTNGVVTLAEGRLIADLGGGIEDHVVLSGLAIPLQPNTQYFVIVGCDPGAFGLLWGFTQDSVGAIGFPSIFTFSANAGVSWQVPFMNALPQRMRVVGDPDSD